MRRIRMSGLLALGCGFVMLAFAGSVGAVMIQYQFSGKVVDIRDFGNIGGVVQIDDPYVATFVFDTTTPDEFPTYPDRAGYSGLSASLVMPHLNVDAKARLDIANSSTFDFIYFNTTTDSGVRFLINLNDHTGTALTSEVIPSPFPTFAGFPLSCLGVFLDRTVADKFGASIDSVNVTIIPEPGVLGLLLLGILIARMRHAP